MLRTNLSSGTTKLDLSAIYHFQQDDDLEHAVKKTKEWLLDTNVARTLLKTSRESSDTSPRENSWHLLDLEVLKTKISNKNDLS